MKDRESGRSVKSYALVGTGGRGTKMFALALKRDFARSARLVAMCDSNEARAAQSTALLPGEPPALYSDFARMLRDSDPDGVIVATRDDTHARYVIAALAAGKRVFCEKPLCTTAAQCRAILKAARASAGLCLVTHNMRYDNAVWQIRQIIKRGTLGRILRMQFDETLDRCHGADYFRRWHRQMANSGGLLIHKASHHFDILNWWADALPASVCAQGSLSFYGVNGSFRGKRCQGCKHAAVCPFYMDIGRRNDFVALYRKTEHEDGYHRDGCVFDPAIDIYDQMQVLVRYANGIEASYNLHAYAPYESMRCVVEGEKGRLEYSIIYDSGRWLQGEQMPGTKRLKGESMRIFLPRRGWRELKIRGKAAGGEHGGADVRLRRDFFGRSWALPANAQMASVAEALQAVLVGIAANQSIASGKMVQVQRLLRGGG